jgi:hypothetical protein
MTYILDEQERKLLYRIYEYLNMCNDVPYIRCNITCDSIPVICRWPLEINKNV